MASVSACSDEGSTGRLTSALPGQEEQQQQHSATDGGGLRALLERSFIGMFEVCMYNMSSTLYWYVFGVIRRIW